MLQLSTVRNRYLIAGGVLMPLLILSGLAIWSRDSSRELVKSSRWIVHSHRVERELEKVQSEVLNAERLERDYLFTRQADDFNDYRNAIQPIPGGLANLHTLVRDDPGQEKNFVRLNDAVTHQLAELDQAVSLQNTGNRAAAVASVNNADHRAATKAVLQAAPVMLKLEDQLLTQRETTLAAEVLHNEHLALWIALVYSILAGGIAFMLWRWAKLRNLIRVRAWSKTVEVDGEYLTFEEYLQKVYRVDGNSTMVTQLADELNPRRRF